MMRRPWGALALAVGIFAGCAAGRPQWVNIGAGAFPKNTRTLYGVGLAEGMKSEYLLRTTADQRAINEISRQITVLTTSLIRDYAAGATAPAEAKSNEEQYVETTIKAFSRTNLSGVTIVDRYRDPKTGTLYSLATLNLEDLGRLADQARDLSQAVRDHIKAHAEEAFQKLKDEEDRQQK